MKRGRIEIIREESGKMTLKISFKKTEDGKADLRVLFIGKKQALSGAAAELDAAGKGFVSHGIKASHFEGALARTLWLVAPEDAGGGQVLLIGLGESRKALAVGDMRKVGAALIKALRTAKTKNAQVLFDHVRLSGDSQPALAAELAFAVTLRDYHFDRYHTDNKRHPKRKALTLTILTDQAAKVYAHWMARQAVAEGVIFARDLVTEPPNHLHPESYAERCVALESHGLKVTVLDEEQMRKLGMNALLAVGEGSARGSRLVVLEWQGHPKAGDQPVALVGKGVTFDSGGISIKPAAGMEDMKFDMGGSAAVVGTMIALAKRKAKVNVVGVIGLVENMLSGTAQRPSDVVTSLSGQTIEVINTDAEGRLVLADALTYAQQHFKPRVVVDLATLTGAIMISLGLEYAGLFSTDDGLAADLQQAGKAVDEKLWPMPLGEAYDKEINSPIADMRNIGTSRWGGSITAAQFLARFIEKDTAWAHLDIAGMAWAYQERLLTPKGASGFGVQLLERWIADHYEDQ